MHVKVSELKEGAVLVSHILPIGSCVLYRVTIDQGGAPQQDLVVGDHWETLIFTGQAARNLCKERNFKFYNSLDAFENSIDYIP